MRHRIGINKKRDIKRQPSIHFCSIDLTSHNVYFTTLNYRRIDDWAYVSFNPFWIPGREVLIKITYVPCSVYQFIHSHTLAPVRRYDDHSRYREWSFVVPTMLHIFTTHSLNSYIWLFLKTYYLYTFPQSACTLSILFPVAFYSLCSPIFVR